MTDLKIVDLSQKRPLTPAHLHAIERSFDRWGPTVPVDIPKLISEIVVGVSCSHSWQKINMRTPTGTLARAMLMKIFEETEFRHADTCKKCSAYCLRDDNGRIWAYDATHLFPKEEEKKPVNKKIGDRKFHPKNREKRG